MSGKDKKKSAVHFTQRNLAKEPNSGNLDSCMVKVGNIKAGKSYIIKQLLDLEYKRLNSRDFENPETHRVRIIPR